MQYVFEGMTLKQQNLHGLFAQKEATEAEKEAALQDLQVGKWWTMGWWMEGHAA